MAWFLNYYICDRCDSPWTDSWSCTCEDDCPRCGSRHLTPFKSADLTTIIEQDGDAFVVLWSPETAEDDPDYRQLGSFSTREKAEEFVAAG
jgi:DNA-directed RNA polymerase subunit RPC12/RpoP